VIRPAPSVDETTIAAELDDLLGAHQASWLSEVLPAGSCLVWAGGPTLAAVLAADATRTVLLIEPEERALEGALRLASSGTQVRGPGALGDLADFASVVVALHGHPDPRELLEPILARHRADAPVAVIASPEAAPAVLEALAADGRSGSIVAQHLRLSSSIALGSEAVQVQGLEGSQHASPAAVIVVSEIEPAPSVLLGRDAGPTQWWTDVDRVHATLHRLDLELRTAEVVRIDELDAALTEANALASERMDRIHELLASTSWRLSAPVRWVIDAKRRR
jgi:hypothetical protein